MEDQGPGGPGPDHPERPGGRPDRSGRPSARAGRRGNGLPAEAFSALTEIDPRLAGTVLEALAEAGIAAWVRPFAGTRGGYLEMRVPARPLDCLFVDASRRGDALSVLAEQVPDLLGLRGRDADEGSAGGATASPSGAGDGAAGGAGGGRRGPGRSAGAGFGCRGFGAEVGSGVRVPGAGPGPTGPEAAGGRCPTPRPAGFPGMARRTRRAPGRVSTSRPRSPPSWPGTRARLTIPTTCRRAANPTGRPTAVPATAGGPGEQRSRRRAGRRRRHQQQQCRRRQSANRAGTGDINAPRQSPTHPPHARRAPGSSPPVGSRRLVRLEPARAT